MKTLITLIIFCFHLSSANGAEISLNQMKPEQKHQLIDLLNQMDPAIIETLLTDEALQWYIEQFNRGGQQDHFEGMDDEEALHGRADLYYDGYNDPKAPQFN